MRPAVGGDSMWRSLYDLVLPTDYFRQLLDMEMRMPHGIAATRFHSSVFSKPENEKSEHYYSRMIASHLTYLNNCMLNGGFASLLADPNMNPLSRFDPIELVNHQRLLQGLPEIGPNNDEPLSSDSINRILTFEVPLPSGQIETFDIVYCRHSRLKVSTELLQTDDQLPQRHKTQLDSLRQRTFAKTSSGENELSIRPDVYDARQETWIHRAIAFQEADLYVKQKKLDPKLVPTCNGAFNPCCQCKYCFDNVLHASDSDNLPTELANVSHRRTPHESTRSCLLALSVILPCTECNYHFGMIQRSKHLEQAFLDYSFPHDLSATSTSEFPSDPNQKKSDLFAKDMIRHAVLAATLPPPKTITVRAGGSDKSVATSSATALVQSSRLEPPNIWQKLPIENVTDQDSVNSDIAQIFEFQTKYWANHEVSRSAIDEMRSRKNVTLGLLMPTGCLLSEQIERTKSPSLHMLNMCGSILFPPIQSIGDTFTRHLHDVQNEVNARQGKFRFEWAEFTSRRLAFGGALGNPAHIWPILISLAMSIQSYCIQWQTSVETLNKLEPNIEKYYDYRFDKFVKHLGSDEMTFYKERLEPIYEQMYKVTKKYVPDHGDPAKLETLRKNNEGLLPAPYVSEEDGAKILNRHKTKLARLLGIVNICLHERHMALAMAKEIEMNGGDTEQAHSWDRLATPNAALKAFNAFLSALVPQFFINPAYRSLVGYFWPIPREYATRPAEYLMIGMWRWHHRTGRLLELVQDTVMTMEHLKTTYSGDTLEQTIPDFQVVFRDRQHRYVQFVNTVSKLQGSEQGRRLLDAHDWQMDEQWMSRFNSDFAHRFAGQLLDVKPMPFFANNTSE